MSCMARSDEMVTNQKKQSAIFLSNNDPIKRKGKHFLSNPTRQEIEINVCLYNAGEKIKPTTSTTNPPTDDVLFNRKKN